VERLVSVDCACTCKAKSAAVDDVVPDFRFFGESGCVWWVGSEELNCSDATFSWSFLAHNALIVEKPDDVTSFI
jgi:hypothetical protein